LKIYLPGNKNLTASILLTLLLVVFANEMKTCQSTRGFQLVPTGVLILADKSLECIGVSLPVGVSRGGVSRPPRRAVEKMEQPAKCSPSGGPPL